MYDTKLKVLNVASFKKTFLMNIYKQGWPKQRWHPLCTITWALGVLITWTRRNSQRPLSPHRPPLWPPFPLRIQCTQVESPWLVFRLGVQKVLVVKWMLQWFELPVDSYEFALVFWTKSFQWTCNMASQACHHHWLCVSVFWWQKEWDTCCIVNHVTLHTDTGYTV